MATREILELIIKGDAKGAIDAFKGTQKAGQDAAASAEATGGKFGSLFDKLTTKFPAVGKAAEKFGLDASNAGGMAGTAATAVGSAIVAFGVKSIKAYQDLAAEVLKFGRVAGTSAEESSKFVEVAGDYGLSVDQVSGAVGKFSKTIGQTPDVLAQYGVAIKHNKDGTVDLEGTLLNAADAYAATDDETKKAALGAALFGKSWQDLIPLLEKGAKGLKSAFDDVNSSQILTDADQKQAEALRLAMDNLSDVVKGLEIQVGKALVPALQSAVDELGNLTGAADKVTSKIGGLGPLINDALHADPGNQLRKQIDAFIPSVKATVEWFTHSKQKARELAEQMAATATQISKNRVEHEELNSLLGTGAAATQNAYKASKENADILAVEADATKKAKDAAEEHAAALKLSAERTKALKDAVSDAINAARAQVDAEFANREAQVRVADQVIKTRDAIKAATDAKMKDNRLNEEAGLAQQQLASDIMDAGEAYAKQQGAADGTKESVKLQSQEIKRLADGYREQFPEIAKLLDDYIFKIQVAANETANAARSVQGFELTAGQILGHKTGDPNLRANGGPVTSGEPYIVGEKGPELFVPGASGQIIPNDALGGMAGGSPVGGGSGSPVYITVNALDPRAAASAVMDALKYHVRVNGPRDIQQIANGR